MPPDILPPMNGLKVGGVIRAIRRRRGLRQDDVALAADVAQKYVSLAERGHLSTLPLPALRRICAALEIDLPFEPRWRGPELDRLLDADHAVIVEHQAAFMAPRGWELIPEYTFNQYGERGSVDLVGWHEEWRALVLQEIKTRLVDQQALLTSNGRKLRIVPPLLARERGWRPTSVGNLLVVLDTSVNRRVVAAHAATFGAAFPTRSRDARRWLARPDGPLAGLWFLSATTLVPIQAKGGPTRVRTPKAPGTEPDLSVDREDAD